MFCERLVGPTSSSKIYLALYIPYPANNFFFSHSIQTDYGAMLSLTFAGSKSIISDLGTTTHYIAAHRPGHYRLALSSTL